MPSIIAALAAGLLFGQGLTVSQMINPAKVTGFLNIFGAWDRSLALVMATAIPVAGLGYALGRRRSAPFCCLAFAKPTQSHVDWRLILGAVLGSAGEWSATAPARRLLVSVSAILAQFCLSSSCSPAWGFIAALSHCSVTCRDARRPYWRRSPSRLDEPLDRKGWVSRHRCSRPSSALAFVSWYG